MQSIARERVHYVMHFTPYHRQCVAVAVISDMNGRVLVSQRHSDSHLGSMWEFPGGKVEADETVEEALVREIDEELRLTITEARPLIRIPYAYPDKYVLLDVWKVITYTGEPTGAEGQAVKWVSLEDIIAMQMPLANKTIVTACQLPDKYMITPEPYDTGRGWNDYLNQLESSLESGIRLLQFRSKSLTPSDYVELAKEVISICHRKDCKVILNMNMQEIDTHMMTALDCDGWHLQSKDLLKLGSRAISCTKLLSASCHSIEEVLHANRIGCDFILLGPVERTLTHPDTAPMGWETFASICDESVVPVYALGGMHSKHLPLAWRSGAQGIAGIRTFWNK